MIRNGEKKSFCRSYGAAVNCFSSAFLVAPVVHNLFHRGEKGPFSLAKRPLLPRAAAIHPQKCASQAKGSALCGGRPGGPAPKTPATFEKVDETFTVRRGKSGSF